MILGQLPAGAVAQIADEAKKIDAALPGPRIVISPEMAARAAAEAAKIRDRAKAVLGGGIGVSALLAGVLFLRR